MIYSIYSIQLELLICAVPRGQVPEYILTPIVYSVYVLTRTLSISVVLIRLSINIVVRLLICGGMPQGSWVPTNFRRANSELTWFFPKYTQCTTYSRNQLTGKGCNGIYFGGTRLAPN